MRFNGIYFIDLNRGWAAGEEKTDKYKKTGIIYHTEDGGLTWKLQYRGIKVLYGIYFLDDNNGWSVGAKGTILKYSP